MEVSFRNSVSEPDLPSPSPLRVADEHMPLLGKLAKPGPLHVALAREYRALFGVGPSDYHAESLHFSCHNGGPYELTLMFVDEVPIRRGNITWFCLKDIGEGGLGDYHWLTLDQLIFCQ